MPDWEKIKAEYLAGGTSYRKLARKYGISESSISRRATKENWTEQREKVRIKADAKVQQKIASDRAAEMAKINRGRTILIDKVLKAIERYPELPGSRIEQSETEFTEETDEDGKKKPKYKTVRTENDLSKLTAMLEKLMAMTGYSVEEPDDDKVVIVDDV